MKLEERNDRLSRAASVIWATIENEHMDYALDGSGELGGQIHASHERFKREAIVDAGYTDVTAYNEDLRSRLAPEYPHMSYRTYSLLSALEVETEEEFLDNNTWVDTGGELSSLAYLKAGAR